MQNERKIDREYLDRRRKEGLAFFVVRFLLAYDGFNGLREEFLGIRRSDKGFQDAGLFPRVRALEESLIFDIKEKAHFLFRDPAATGDDRSLAEDEFARLLELLQSDQDPSAMKEQAAQVFRGLRRSLICKAIDSYVGTGFHLFLILRESIYQLEHYGPLFRQEHNLIAEAETLARQAGYLPSENELYALAQIREIDSEIQFAVSENGDLAERAFERCRELFRKTAELLRRHIEESEVNEVLVLNLLRYRKLVERIYGDGELEKIFDRMLRGIDLSGKNGLERAESCVRRFCGNHDGLSRHD